MGGVIVGMASAGAAALSGSAWEAEGIGGGAATLRVSGARGAATSNSMPSKPVRCSASIESKSLSGGPDGGVAAGLAEVPDSDELDGSSVSAEPPGAADA